MAVHLEGVHSVFTPKTKRRPEKGEATATSLNRNTPKQKVSCGASRCTTPSVLRRRIPAQCLRCNARTLSSRGPANAPLHVLGKPGPHRPGPTPLPNPTVSSTPCFRDSPAPLAPKCLLSSQPLQPDPPILLPSQRGRPCRTGLPRRRRGRWPSGPAPATPLAASTPDAPTTTPLPAASRSPRRPAPLPPQVLTFFAAARTPLSSPPPPASASRPGCCACSPCARRCRCGRAGTTRAPGPARAGTRPCWWSASASATPAAGSVYFPGIWSASARAPCPETATATGSASCCVCCSWCVWSGTSCGSETGPSFRETL